MTGRPTGPSFRIDRYGTTREAPRATVRLIVPHGQCLQKSGTENSLTCVLKMLLSLQCSREGIRHSEAKEVQRMSVLSVLTSYSLFVN